MMQPGTWACGVSSGVFIGCALLIHPEWHGILAGLLMEEAWRSLLLRRTDPSDALAMFWYYLDFRSQNNTRRWPHPRFNTKYNALQRAHTFLFRSPGFSLQQAGRS